MITVVGIFKDKARADAAIKELENQNFNPKDISIIAKEAFSETQDVGFKGGSAAEGAVSGAATGGVVGGLTGLLVGIGVLAIPGVGAFLVSGPIAAALGVTGATAMTISGVATGALAGGVVGGLMGLGIPEENASEYANRIEEGAVLLAVPVGEERNLERVTKLFTQNNAEEIRMIDRIGRA